MAESRDRFAQDPSGVDREIVRLHRAEWGRLLSMLVARTRRLDLAEDGLSEAFARASARWPTSGVPDNPVGWLYTTAWRQVIGAIRAEAMRGRKAPLLAVGVDWHDPVPDDLDALGDERLALILLCCHPALHPAARPALALRLVIGTPTREIARLFLVPTATMAARITRAKKKIVVSGIPLSRPAGDELRLRLDDVCRTIYLAFTAGYTPGEGPDLLRADLAGEAVELGAVLHEVVPDATQVQALYGLLRLQHARREARVHNGQLVTLAEQDRSRWHREEMAVGMRLVSELAPSGGYGESLRLQGRIAGEHARATTAIDTDWRAIAGLYAELEQLTGSPIVRLNRAVAVAEAEDAAAGLLLLEHLDDALGHHHRLHAVRADLASRAGRLGAARTSYEAAIELCRNEVEREFLLERLGAIDGSLSRRSARRPPS